MPVTATVTARTGGDVDPLVSDRRGAGREPAAPEADGVATGRTSANAPTSP